MRLRDIPSVNILLNTLRWERIELPREYVVDIVRRELSAIRKLAKDGDVHFDEGQIVSRVRSEVRRRNRASLTNVINGTGIILHTGLGRAPFSQSLLRKVADDMRGYSALELNLQTGRRGERLHHITPLLNSLTGAKDSIVVNNNAAAVLLSLNSLAEGKDVVVSRGQLVEIGGLFRIPDVIRKSGASLVEVGTTNRTHLEDYVNGLSRNAGVILMVHTSNYRIQGFTKEVPLVDLAKLSAKKRVPLIVDLGSGALFNLEEAGLPHEPVVSDALDQGASLVTFSGDKLLGGPQSGLICGKKHFISKLHKNPMYRALRCDKMTLALLERTLRSYRQAPPGRENMTYQLFTTSRRTLINRGRKLVASMRDDDVRKLGVSVVHSEVEAGSGSLPTELLESAALRFQSEILTPSSLSERFRKWNPPIVGYSSRNRFYLDLKAIPAEEYQVLRKAMKEIAKGVS
ncbi:MAG: L-seryl-tRNA(Sec) selenium transferase [Candidatus Neomarinimicrobiota bacterium]